MAGLLLGGAAEGFAQEYIREFHPYWRDPEAYAPMLQSDTTLFYRAVQQAADLYAAAGDYALPRVASGRRGYRSGNEPTLLNGMTIDNYRTRTLLRLLGARETVYAGASAASASAESAGAAGNLRLLHFGEEVPLQPALLALSLTDRNYRVGLRGSWSGDLGRNWYASTALDLRTGRDLHIEGVFTDAVTAGARLVRTGRAENRFELSFAVPLSIYGGRSASVEEAFVLTGDRLYNPAWGLQNGKVRNARVRREAMPMAQIHWTTTLTDATTLAFTLGAETGLHAYSGLNWYDARTPLPDNYRYLPGYIGDRESGEAWHNRDPRFTQIDWDRMIRTNRIAGGRAVYALEEEVEQPLRAEAGVRFATRAGRHTQLRYGLEARYRQARRYKRMRDLLGATYVVDIDQYLVDDDTYGNRLQNDLRHPDRLIGEGARFGHDYTLVEEELRAWVQAQWESDRLQAGISAAFGSAVRFRNGHYEKELFPGANSWGRSRRMRFAPWAVRAFAGWAFSTRSRIELAAVAAAAAPDAEALFYQPLYNNRTVDAPRTELHAAADVTWRLSGRVAEWQTTLFVTLQQHLGYTSRYYDDWAGSYADLAVADLGIGAAGIESALRVRLAARWQLTAAAAWVRSRYTHNPTVTILADTDNRLLDDRSTSYLGDCRPGGMPQGTASLEAGYFGPKGWGFKASAGYAGGRYVEPEPIRRTQRIARQAGTTPEAYAAFVAQERLGDAFTLDAALFKSFRIGREARLTLTLLARNLTDDAARYNGYESPRIRRRYAGDTLSWEPHASRYTYVYPRSFYLSAVCRF